MRAVRIPVLILFLSCLAAPFASAQPFSADHTPVAVDTEGRIGVIVELDLRFTPEGDLPDVAAVAAQRASLRRAQRGLLARLAGLGVAEVHEFQYVPYVSMFVSEAALRALERAPGIAAIHPDRWSAPAITESIPLIGANLTSYPGSNSAVAVLDSGIESGHPALWQRVLSQACYGTNDANFTSLCPGGATAATGAGTGEPCTGVGTCSHGTNIAGIITGQLDVKKGVAPTARLISIKIYSKGITAVGCFPGQPPCLRSKESDEIKGLERVLWLHYNDPTFQTFKIAAANLSFGSGKYTSQAQCNTHPLKAPIDNLRSVGIATVAASGNNGHVDGLHTPACISTVISVGNTTKQDVVYHSSNSASFLTLLAPGTSITTTTPGGYTSTPVTGTSFAAPHVAGAFAQLKHKRPNATVTQMLNALVSTGLPILDGRNGITKPRIRVDAAVNALP